MSGRLTLGAVALCLAAGSAPAQEQPQMSIALPAACEFSSQLGRFLSTAEIENSQGPRVVQEIIPDTMQTGLAYFEVEDLHGAGDGSKWLVLQHCPSSQDLLVRLDANGETVRTRLWDMIVSTEEYTMDEVARVLTELGGHTELGDVDLGDCACEHQRFYFGN
ncbi:MAG: hypothetical protein KDJ98_05065 [Rhodobacteraceae bacterium]|nr:hypothetical protein [Paracoccaceae bacterium]